MIVDDWAAKSKVDHWQAWTSWLVSPRPQISTIALNELRAAHEWLFRRVWPGEKPHLEAALQNYRVVANDLSSVLDRSLVKWTEDDFIVDTFYKYDWHEQVVYNELADQFEWVVDLIHDLTFELTRAANWVLDVVRRELDPLYHVDEGVLIVERDEGIFNYVQWRVAYTRDEIADWPPYRGLVDFTSRRDTRTTHCGEGLNPRALRRVTPISLS